MPLSSFSMDFSELINSAEMIFNAVFPIALPFIATGLAVALVLFVGQEIGKRI